MEPLVSVIVPVYNVQDYLDECLASLEKQTLENIEVIMVNDGSTDASGGIMDGYARRHPGKFICCDKPNEGPGPARNFGLGRARGGYIAFVDSDDFAEPDMLERLYAAAQTHNCDIVQCGMFVFDNNDGYQAVERAPFEEEGFIPQKTLMLRATRPGCVSVYTKLYRKNLFDKCRFPAIWYEDLALLPVLFAQMKGSFYYLPQPLYHYRWAREGSVITTAAQASPRALDVFAAQQYILDCCKPEWQAEAECAVYEHNCRFFAARPQISVQALAFVWRHAARFAANAYVQQDVAAGLLPKLLPAADAHPKIIHTCRIAGAPLCAEARACRDSWQALLPGYTLREWTENDAMKSESAYVRQALLQKDWPAVAGYLACKALFEEGGVYLDPGLRLKRPLADALGYAAVLPMAGEGAAAWEAMAAKPGHPLLADMLGLYQHTEYRPGGAQADAGGMRGEIFTLLREKYALPQGEGARVLPQGILTYPATALLMDAGDGASLAEITCDGFAAQDGAPAPLRHWLQKRYYLARYAPPALPKNTPDIGLVGEPRQVAEAVVCRYGVWFMLRAVARRVAAVLLGKGNS